MKKKNPMKCAMLRKVFGMLLLGTLPALVVFTDGKAQSNNNPRTRVIFKHVSSKGEVLRVEDDGQKKDYDNSIFEGMTERQKDIYKRYYIPNLKEPAKDLEHQTLTEDQIVVSDLPMVCGDFIKYIETDEHETRVTFVYPITWDRNWLQFGKGECLVDSKTGDVYRCRGVARGIELNKALWVHDKRGKMIEFTVVYDPLKPSVKKVDFVTKFPDENGPTPPNAGGNELRKNIEVAKYAPGKEEVVYNYLLDRQTPVIELEYGCHDVKLLSFLREKDETKVIFAMEVVSENQWIEFGSGWVIRDCLSKEKYSIKRVERGIPLDRVNMIRGKKGQFVTFTMVFPYVPMNVKFVDIMQLPGAKEMARPVTKQNISWYNVFVENNRFPYNTPETISDNRMTHPQDCLVTEIQQTGKASMQLIVVDNGKTELNIRIPRNGKYKIPAAFAIRDCESGKVFYVKNLGGNYKLDQTIELQANSDVKLYFDNLPYGIDKIDVGILEEDNNILTLKNVAINN